MEISIVIKNARTNAGYTQEQAAEKLLVSRQTISNWENGKTLPDIVSVLNMSDLYQISLDELLKGDNKMVEKIKKDEERKIFDRLVLLVAALSIVVGFVCNLLTVLRIGQDNSSTYKILHSYLGETSIIVMGICLFGIYFIQRYPFENSIKYGFGFVLIISVLILLTGLSDIAGIFVSESLFDTVSFLINGIISIGLSVVIIILYTRKYQKIKQRKEVS